MKIKSQLFTLLSALTLSLSFTQIAQANDDNLDVTPEQQTTAQEFAALYVLSDICPKMVSNPEKFSTGFTTLLTEYLPNEKNPVQALNKMVTAANFKAILQEAESDAQRAGKEKI